MEVTLLFLVTVLAFAGLLLYDCKAAFFVAVLFYGIYPRFFSLGFADDGFAMTMQRAMLLMLLAMYVLRLAWGSAEIRHGWQVLSRHPAALIALLTYLMARLVGNFFTGRLDLSVIGQLLSESLISIFVLLLVVSYVRTRKDIVLLLTLVMASLFFNQLVSVYEFIAQEPIFPEGLSLRYEVGGRGEEVLAGRVRDSAFRAMGIFDNPLKLTALLGMALPLVIYLARCGTNMLTRVVSAASVVLALPTAFFSGSRAAIGVVLLVFAWYVYLWVTRRMSAWGRRLVATAGVLCAVAVVALFADELLNELLFGDAYARSTEARFRAYVTVPLLLIEAPLFGFGYARNIVETLDLGALDPFYLRLALEGGVVSLVGFIAFMVAVARLLGPVTAGGNSPDATADAALARALRVSLAVIALLALLLTLSYVRMYLFLFAGVAMVLLDLWLRDQQPATIADQSR